MADSAWLPTMKALPQGFRGWGESTHTLVLWRLVKGLGIQQGTSVWVSWFGPGIRGIQVKSSGNEDRMSPSRGSDGAYFSETPPSWRVRPIFSLIAIL